MADVVLQVLDARDPMGCRSAQVERAIVAAGARKKLVLVLNKIDLVPKEIVEKWVKYLRNEFPTLAFKGGSPSLPPPYADGVACLLTAGPVLGHIHQPLHNNRNQIWVRRKAPRVRLLRGVAQSAEGRTRC